MMEYQIFVDHGREVDNDDSLQKFHLLHLRLILLLHLLNKSLRAAKC